MIVGRGVGLKLVPPEFYGEKVRHTVLQMTRMGGRGSDHW